jgi:threonine dehydrogenase-like Zn-dependent dehydrogenase
VTLLEREPVATTVSPRKTTMRAAVVKAPHEMEVVETAVPLPRSNEVRVQIEGCGVCASNIPPWEGRPWFTYPLKPGQLGHEAWGIIDAVGPDVINLHVGQRVAMISDHAYAEYDCAQEGNVVVLPDELSGRPFPAEPLGCAVNIFRRCQIKPGDNIAIVGIGFLGAILTRLASNINANVIAISRRAFSLDIAHRMGATHLIPMDDHQRIIDKVRELTGGHFCDVTVEAVGKQWPIDLSGEITRERGRLVIAGYHQDGLRQVNMQLWNWRGFDIVSAHERDPAVYLRGMQVAVDLVNSGKLDPTPLYTHRFSLEQLGEALDATANRPDGFLKALIMMR